jgi:hypothetical protein
LFILIAFGWVTAGVPPISSPKMSKGSLALGCWNCWVWTIVGLTTWGWVGWVSSSSSSRSDFTFLGWTGWVGWDEVIPKSTIDGCLFCGVSTIFCSLWPCRGNSPDLNYRCSPDLTLAIWSS